MPATSVRASVDDDALIAYARAQAADSFGAPTQASQGYAAALTLAPNNEVLAARALSQALNAGNRPLAVRAARILETAGKLAPDGRLLLLSEALRTRKWKDASAQIDRIEKDEAFSFMAPLLRAWVAQGSGKGDPLALLDAGPENVLGNAYAAGHRPLLLLARGKKEEGLAALEPVLAEGGARAQRLRIAAAAFLARKGDRAAAAKLLDRDTAPIAAARKRLEARQPISGEISTAPEGVAELLIRIAIDLNSQDVPQLALSFARLATFLAPENGEAWLVASQLLATSGREDAALAALGNIAADDPYADSAIDTRVALLVAGSRQDEAVGLIKAAIAARPQSVDNWSRLGDLYGQMKRQADAADAYGKAIELSRQGLTASRVEWTLWLLRGGALTQAGKWPEAKAALEEAYKLAPQQAVVLNYLGYSQLERRENIQEAERLISAASALQPDDAGITDSLGWAHYVRGDLPKAIELLERAAQAQAADPAINEHLGDAYYSAGRHVDARYAWKAALVYADGDVATRLRAKLDSGLRPDLTAP